jgi:MraZ protein
LFLGKYACALHGENRLAVPTAVRDQLSGGAYITQGFDRNLLILTAGAFREIYRSVTSLNMADPLARSLVRLILSSAQPLNAESDGHLAIPEDLKGFAGLNEKALLIGQGDYLEVWSPELWLGQEEQLRDVEANSERFSMLMVSTRSN